MARPTFNLNSGPMLSLLTIGVSGSGAVGWQEYVSILLPICIGILLSSIDDSIKIVTRSVNALTLPVMGSLLRTGSRH